MRSGYRRPPIFPSSPRSRPPPVLLMVPCPSSCLSTSWEPSRFCSSSYVLHPNYQKILLAPPSPSTQNLATAHPSMAATMASATIVSCRDCCSPPPQSLASALAPDRWFPTHILCELDHILSLLKTLPSLLPHSGPSVSGLPTPHVHLSDLLSKTHSCLRAFACAVCIVC